MAAKGSKNNIANRGQGAKEKTYQGKPVEPVMYISNGRYVAARFKGGALVMDNNGKPIPYSAIN
jgi:hypothetical protein